MTRWRYGQKAHLESSLEALKLWDEDEPPQLLSIEERAVDGRYGLALRFRAAGVPFSRWQDKQERLGRFFDKGLQARLSQPAAGDVLLELLPQTAAGAPAAPAPQVASPAADSEPTTAQS